MLIYINDSITIHLFFVNNLTGSLNNKSYIAIHVRMLIYIIDIITIHLIFVNNLTSILNIISHTCTTAVCYTHANLYYL